MSKPSQATALKIYVIKPHLRDPRIRLNHHHDLIVANRLPVSLELVIHQDGGEYGDMSVSGDFWSLYKVNDQY